MTTPKIGQSSEERAQGRRWLESWRVAGALLEAERAARLVRLSDADSATMALDLWRFARPAAGDDAEGLMLFKRVIHSARR